VHLNHAAWHSISDVVVVGSGGAALTAAVLAADGGASVTIVEKSDVLGGTTGVSGGAMWIPNNHHLATAGLQDSAEDARDYIRCIADGRELDPVLIDTFGDQAPAMIDYLEHTTPLRTQAVTNLHDYYEVIRDRIPGCKDFSRSIEALPFPAREELGSWADRIAARSTLLSLGADTTLKEDEAARGRGGPRALLEVLAQRERDGVRVKGAALVAALLAGLLARDVDIRLSTPARELVVDGDGSVVGVLASTATGEVRLGARKAVILACGGFEWNREMVLGYIGYDVQPLSPGDNVGDGHLMASAVGAQMGHMGSYWGQGAGFDPSITRDDGVAMPQMMRGLGAGSIIVNRRGQRFTAEGYTYNDFPKAFGNFDASIPGYPNLPPAWVVFGPSVKEGRSILTVRPQDPAPDWMAQADSIRDLAALIDVDPATLAATVRRYNEHAEAGEDPDCGVVDPRPIDGPPYFAVQQWPATLGTSGGCRITPDGQVLGAQMRPIPGLYAAGNTASAPLGGAYLGGGTPIAVGMTFGYLAGRHAASRASRDLDAA
jgi:3-oxosteroid 1-dehydrogenase